MAEEVQDPHTEIRESTTTFGPSRGAVLGTLAAGLVFTVVLEFLVLISFLGQRIWRDPRLGSDLIFTLPLLLWVLVLVVCIIAGLRIVTCWFRFTDTGVSVNGLLRSQRHIRWEDVDRVLAVHTIQRGSAPASRRASDGAFESIILLGADGERLVTVSNRFYGLEAQRALLIAASEAGREVVEIRTIGPKELRSIAPHALGPLDAHPSLMLLAAVVFYLAHNALTFTIWGL